MAREGPVPSAWVKFGAPPEAMAAYAEGMCPRHGTQLSEGMFRTGGWVPKDPTVTGVPIRWIPGGWCDACAAWWHRPYGRAAELAGARGLGATWGPGYGPDS